jgi:hypothetical protein
MRNPKERPPAPIAGQRAINGAAGLAQLLQVVRSAERPFMPCQKSLKALLGGLLAKEERVGDMAGTDEDTRRCQVLIGLG